MYDRLGRPWTVTDANGVTFTNQFDSLNRLTARAWQDGFGENFGYSTNGLIAHTNRSRKVTLFARDDGGRLRSTTNANLESIVLDYNALNQVTDLWDGMGNHTKWNYNAHGWLTNKLDASNREVVRYTHDFNGRITNRWTPQFGDTALAYDAMGNLTNVNYGSSTIRYSYDQANRLSGMTDASGVSSFYYAGGHLAWEVGPFAAPLLIWWSYANGRRSAVGTLEQMGQDPSWASGYTYDAAWRLTNLTSSAGSFDYGYNLGQSVSPASLVRNITLPNAASITHHYDSLSRLDHTELVDRWGHVLDGHGYIHDLAGLRTNIVRELGLTTNSVAVGYDAIGQVISWKARDPGGSNRLHEQFGFAFDKAGNVRYRTNGALVQTFTNNPFNQLTNISRMGTLTVSGALPAPASSVTVNGQQAERYGDFTFARTNLALTGNDAFTIIAQNQFGSATNSATYNLPASVALKWDANGNLSNDGTRIFVYNAENRLVTNWVANAWKTEFVYDGLGRRRIMREYGWTGSWSKTNELHYIYDGFLLVQVRDANNNILESYTRGPDLSGSLQGAGGIGGVLARTDSAGNSLFYHSDGAGNITALMDMAGNVTGRYQYGPFGRLSGMWGPMAAVNVMRFSSMPYHDKAGISSFTFRDYDSTLQRFLTQDPIGEYGGLNLYGFVCNNPIDRMDPLGLVDEFFPGLSPEQTHEYVEGSKILWGGLWDFLNPPAQEGVVLGVVPGYIGGPGSAGKGMANLLNRLKKLLRSECRTTPTFKMPASWPGQKMKGMAKDHAIPQALDPKDPRITASENLRGMPAAMNSIDKAHFDAELAQRYRQLVEDLQQYEGISEAAAKQKAWTAMQEEIKAHANSVPARPMDPNQLDQLPPK